MAGCAHEGVSASRASHGCGAPLGLIPTPPITRPSADMPNGYDRCQPVTSVPCSSNTSRSARTPWTASQMNAELSWSGSTPGLPARADPTMTDPSAETARAEVSNCPPEKSPRLTIPSCAVQRNAGASAKFTAKVPTTTVPSADTSLAMLFGKPGTVPRPTIPVCAVQRNPSTWLPKLLKPTTTAPSADTAAPLVCGAPRLPRGKYPVDGVQRNGSQKPTPPGKLAPLIVPTTTVPSADTSFAWPELKPGGKGISGSMPVCGVKRHGASPNPTTTLPSADADVAPTSTPNSPPRSTWPLTSVHRNA